MSWVMSKLNNDENEEKPTYSILTSWKSFVYTNTIPNNVFSKIYSNKSFHLKGRLEFCKNFSIIMFRDAAKRIIYN